ncbi:MAG: L-erythro-3,5-diaminohexanoate dehydrogenase, partial [Clostridiales bacterium]|nr:L-erythro-3,5-diaminohexanoate dehydrogenase [Clostridiales bacterium]
MDNDPVIFANEILIDVIALQPTATAFGRIKNECDGDTERIARTILDIVEDRGKFQDPVT